MKTVSRAAFLAVLLAVSASAPVVYAQQAQSPLSGGVNKYIKFDHLTTENGLSNDSVWGMAQDSDGFMWFGTFDGLNRYDGSSVKVFRHDPDDPQSLSGNAVRGMCIDHTGVLWIGTWGNGLNQFDRETEQFIRYRHDPDDPHSLSNDAIRAIYEDRAGTLWVCTMGGLNKFDRETKQFTRYRNESGNPDSLGNNIVWTVYEDPSGMLWIGTEGGLDRFDPASVRFVHFRHNPDDSHSLSHNSVRSICMDQSGTLWIGTFGGLNRFNQETEQFTRYKHEPTDSHSLTHDSVSLVYEDPTGILWIGTWGGGLNQFDRETETFTHYQSNAADSYSLNNDNVYLIYEDRAGISWIATDGGGVNILDRGGKPFHHYRPIPDDPNSLSHNAVRALYEDRTGVLWIGTNSGGLNKLDRRTGQFTHYQHDTDDPNSLRSNSVWVIYEDRMGSLWLGGFGSGLNTLDQETEEFTHCRHDSTLPHSLSNNNVVAMYEDRAGILWIGTWGGGLNKFERETEQFISYQHNPAGPNTLSHNQVTTIYEDRAGVIWIGTMGGLNRFEPETGVFTRYLHDPANPNSLGNNSVISIHEDRGGRFWIGTIGGGLDKFDREHEQFIHYTIKDGLPGNTVFGILEEDVSPDGAPNWEGGNLWLATTWGLSRFNPRKETFRNYDVSDGLQSNSFLPINAYHKSHRGELLFGGSNGFNAFYPDQIKDNPHIPPVVITDFQLANKPVPIGGDSVLQKSILETGHLTLSHLDRVFSFEFAALNYRASEKNRYRYKMEGFEKDWNEVDSARRFATYTNLDPGEYVFRVIGSNNDGIWNEQGAAVKITVLSPWWETIWFRASLLLSALGLIFGGLRWRVSIIVRQKRRLEIQVNERTHDLDERVKELNCLYGLAQLVETSEMSLSGIFQGIVDLIPSAWQYPNITSARLAYDGHEYTTENFTVTPWRQTADIRVHGQALGRLEVVYMEARPARDEGPFIHEERRLLDALAKRLGRIIESKQAEEALRDSENLLREAQAIGEFGHWVWDRDTDTLTWSDEVYHIFGHQPGTFHPSAEAFEAAIHPDDLETFLRKRESMLREHQKAYIEHRIIRSDGNVRHVAERTELELDDDDKVRRVMGTVQDITERKQAEEALKAAKQIAEEARQAAMEAQRKAEHANHAKSTFLANMSHELRTPLNAILGFAQVMARSRKMPSEEKENLTIIRRSGEHLLNLINDVLDMSKIEAGRTVFNQQDFDLYRLLDDIENMFCMQTEKIGLQLSVKCDANVPQYIRSDEGKLRQVLVNLLNNALKFTNKGGISVKVEGRRKKVEEGRVKDGNHSENFHPSFFILHISVEDTGPGIASDEQSSLFDPFIQAESGRQSLEGTGLGLPISRKFVQMMGGDITVESVVGKGSVFRFGVRVEKTKGAKLETTLPERRVIALEPDQPGYRILIVDDIESNRLLLLKLLALPGFELCDAHNGKEAVELWEKWDPHLILMDMRMPVMDGYKATKVIRDSAARNPGPATRSPVIIAVTASAFEEERKIVLSAGCDDFIRKPFRKAEIFEMLTRHLAVRFIYEKPDRTEAEELLDKEREDLIADALAALAALPALPAEWITGLEQAILNIDLDKAIHLIEQISERDAILADTLKRYFDDFEYEKILTLIREAASQGREGKK